MTGSHERDPAGQLGLQLNYAYENTTTHIVEATFFAQRLQKLLPSNSVVRTHFPMLKLGKFSICSINQRDVPTE
jgi:hypothetical protein